jgi:hypothetical protein
MSGLLTDPVVEGELALSEFATSGLRLDAAQAQGVASASSWTLRRGTVRAYGAEVAVSGRGGREKFQLAGRVDRADVAVFERAFEHTLPFAGVLSGTFEVTGPYSGAGASFEGAVGNATILGHAAGDVGVRVRVEGLHLDAKLSAFDGAVVVDGGLDLTDPWPFSAVVESRNLPWALVPREPLPAGLVAETVSGGGAVEGALGAGLSALRAEWAGQVRGARWGSVDLGTVGIRADYRDNGGSFSLNAWDGAVRLEGLAATGEEVPFETWVAVDSFPVAQLGGLLSFPMSGQISAQGRALVATDKWTGAQGLARFAALADLELEGTISGLSVAGGVKLPEWRVAVASSDGIPDLRVTSEGIEVQGRLEDPKTATWRVWSRFKEFTPARLFPPDHPAAELAGSWTGKAEARGTGPAVKAAAAAGQVGGLGWGPLAPSSWTWSGKWEEDAASLEAREPRGVGLQARWDPQRELAVRLEFENTPLRGWVRGARVPADLGGSIRGKAELTIPTEGQPRGRVVLSRLLVDLPPVRLENREEVAVRYGSGEICIESLGLQGQDVDLQASGWARPGAEWALDFDGLVDLALLSRWVPGVREASGTGRVELEVRGPWDEPHLGGPLEIRPGATVAIEGLDYPFEKVDASGYLEGERGLTIEWVDAQFVAGRVHLEGTVDLDRFRPGRLRVAAELRDVAYEAPPQVSYVGDADLLVTGSATRPELRGEVRLQELLYARRLNWKTMVFEALQRRPKTVKGTTEEGTVAVDLTIRGSENLRVENNLADLAVGLELRARGYLPDPVLWGRVEVLGGTARFRTLEYDVKRSSVEFLGETQPVPLLDIHARTLVQHYEVSVNVSGPLDDFQVGLASTPPVSQTDIVALLTYGSTVEEMEGGQGVGTAEAASLLTGRFQDELESGVGVVLGLDEFNIDPAYSPSAQTTVPRVTVGKTVTPSLRARYSAAIGVETEQELEVQYKLTPRVSVLGTWTDQGSESKGSLGGEVRLRFTFR